MDYVSQLLRVIGFIPAVVTGIEGLFGDKPGAEKKDAAMSFVQSALSITRGRLWTRRNSKMGSARSSTEPWSV
jgi:hypothetical protein